MILSNLIWGSSPQTGKRKKLSDDSDITDETTKKKLEELEYDFFRKQYIPKQQPQQPKKPNNHLLSPSATIVNILPQHQYEDDEDEILNTRTNYLPHLLRDEMKDDEYDQYVLLQQQEKEREERERLEALKKNPKSSLKYIMNFVYTSLKLVTGESNKIIPRNKLLLNEKKLYKAWNEDTSSFDGTHVGDNSEIEEKEKKEGEGEKEKGKETIKREEQEGDEIEEEEDILNKRLDDDPNLYRKKMKFVPFDEEEMEIFHETETILQIYKNLHPNRNNNTVRSTNMMIKQYFPSSSPKLRPKSPHYRNSDSLTSTKIAPDPNSHARK